MTPVKMMKQTSSTRAMATVINYLDMEIIARRDTALSADDKRVVQLFIQYHRALMRAWNQLGLNIDPISYALAWDAEMSRRCGSATRCLKVRQKATQGFLSDVSEVFSLLARAYSFDSFDRREKELASATSINTYAFS